MEYKSRRNFKCRINEFTHNNLRHLSLENELIKTTILLDKGADIYEIIYKPTDTDYLWKSPCGFLKPNQGISSIDSDIGGFLDYYQGGWQEVCPGGGPYEYKGAKIGHHGEAALLPWNFSVIEDQEDIIKIECFVELVRYPFVITKTIEIRSGVAAIFFNSKIENKCGQDMHFIWGQHPCFGDTFIKPGLKLEIPAKNFVATGKAAYPNSFYETGYEGIWPMGKGEGNVGPDLSIIPPADPPTAELFYIKDLQDGWYAINDTENKTGIGMAWDVEVYPYLWFWRVLKGDTGHPFYGRSYHVALEPFSSFPNDFGAAMKNNTIKMIKPFGTIETAFTFVVFNGLESVNKITVEGNVF